MMLCGYCDGPEGQIHYREMGEGSEKAPLICLHPAPFSGLAFTNIMPHLSKGRRVIAPDFPGHGGSHAVSGQVEIADFAQAILALIAQVCEGQRVDIFGFHTGNLVAAEMAIVSSATIRRMVLCDVPGFAPEQRAQMLESSGAPPGFTPDLSSLAPSWERGITRRIESQGMARSFEIFVEQLRHGEAMNTGFEACFRYAVEERFARVSGGDVTILASQSGLLEATRRAATLIPGATLIERLDITRAVLDEAAPKTAAAVLEILEA